MLSGVRTGESEVERESEDFVWERMMDADANELIDGEVAVDEALPLGIRKPDPGAGTGELGCLGGKETEAERRLVFEVALRASTDFAEGTGDFEVGTGDPRRLILMSPLMEE